VEVQEGDFISFLYGARAHNLYQVIRREAIREFATLPPWPPVTFRESGRTYHFPFRHWLETIREFDEPLVRSEFAYVAENLLLRAGYRKTHFQADQTTLQNVSQMGNLSVALWALPRSLLFLCGRWHFPKLISICGLRTPCLTNPSYYLISVSNRSAPANPENGPGCQLDER